MLSQLDLFLFSSSAWHRQQVLPLTPGGRVQWEWVQIQTEFQGTRQDLACSRNSDYFLLCFTDTEAADPFHSCGAQITHWPVASQTLSGCSTWFDTSKWSPVDWLDIRKISIRIIVQHLDRLLRTSVKPLSLEFFNTWLDKVMADLIYSWW